MVYGRLWSLVIKAGLVCLPGVGFQNFFLFKADTFQLHTCGKYVDSTSITQSHSHFNLGGCFQHTGPLINAGLLHLLSDQWLRVSA